MYVNMINTFHTFRPLFIACKPCIILRRYNKHQPFQNYKIDNTSVWTSANVSHFISQTMIWKNFECPNIRFIRNLQS